MHKAPTVLVLLVAVLFSGCNNSVVPNSSTVPAPLACTDEGTFLATVGAMAADAHKANKYIPNYALVYYTKNFKVDYPEYLSAHIGNPLGQSVFSYGISAAAVRCEVIDKLKKEWKVASLPVQLDGQKVAFGQTLFRVYDAVLDPGAYIAAIAVDIEELDVGVTTFATGLEGPTGTERVKIVVQIWGLKSQYWIPSPYDKYSDHFLSIAHADTFDQAVAIVCKDLKARFGSAVTC